MGLEREDSGQFANFAQLPTESEPPAGTGILSPGRTLRLISKPESTLTVPNTEAAQKPGAHDCDPNSTNLEEAENSVESGGTLSDEPVAAGPDASLKDSDRSTIGPSLFLVAIVVILLAFVAGIWLGIQSDHLRRATVARKLPMKRANTPVAPIGSTTPFSASAGVPADRQPSSASGQVPLLAVTPKELSKFPRVTGIRHWSSADSTNIVLDLEDKVQYEAHRVPSPDRIYFDLHNTQLAPDLVGKSITLGQVPVNRIRIAQPVIGTTRIVLETDRTSDFAVNMGANPYRLVIQVREIAQTSGKR